MLHLKCKYRDKKKSLSVKRIVVYTYQFLETEPRLKSIYQTQFTERITQNKMQMKQFFYNDHYIQKCLTFS